MEVKRPCPRGRTAFAVAVFLMAILPAAGQRLVLDPPAFPSSAPRSHYRLVEAFPGLTFPYRSDDIVGLANAPGQTNALYVIGLFGRIHVITNLARPTKTVFLDISRDTYGLGASRSESGLLGLAFHPRYVENGWFYAFYSRTNRAAGKTYSTVSRFQRDPANPWRAVRASERILISQFDERDNHQGGDMHFGPDGFPYISVGTAAVPPPRSRMPSALTVISSAASSGLMWMGVPEASPESASGGRHGVLGSRRQPVHRRHRLQRVAGGSGAGAHRVLGGRTPQPLPHGIRPADRGLVRG